MFSDYRQRLFPIALNMLGNADDAEDLVQETMLKWLSMEKREDIDNPQGYLVKTLINKCLNFIRDNKRTKSGVDIAPELLVDHMPSLVENRMALSLGMQAMLEKLTSLERAVFLLKEIFHYSHREIAELLDISEEYARQILARARRHIKSDRQRFESTPEQHRELYRSFLDACEGQDMKRLLEVLKEDIRIDISRPAASAAGISTLYSSAEELLMLHQAFPGMGYELMRFGNRFVWVATWQQQAIWTMGISIQQGQLRKLQINITGDWVWEMMMQVFGVTN